MATTTATRKNRIHVGGGGAKRLHTAVSAAHSAVDDADVNAKRRAPGRVPLPKAEPPRNAYNDLSYKSQLRDDQTSRWRAIAVAPKRGGGHLKCWINFSTPSSDLGPELALPPAITKHAVLHGCGSSYEGKQWKYAIDYTCGHLPPTVAAADPTLEREQRQCWATILRTLETTIKRDLFADFVRPESKVLGRVRATVEKDARVRVALTRGWVDKKGQPADRRVTSDDPEYKTQLLNTFMSRVLITGFKTTGRSAAPASDIGDGAVDPATTATETDPYGDDGYGGGGGADETSSSAVTIADAIEAVEDPSVEWECYVRMPTFRKPYGRGKSAGAPVQLQEPSPTPNPKEADPHDVIQQWTDLGWEHARVTVTNNDGAVIPPPVDITKRVVTRGSMVTPTVVVRASSTEWLRVRFEISPKWGLNLNLRGDDEEVKTMTSAPTWGVNTEIATVTDTSMEPTTEDPEDPIEDDDLEDDEEEVAGAVDLTSAQPAVSPPQSPPCTAAEVERDEGANDDVSVSDDDAELI